VILLIPKVSKRPFRLTPLGGTHGTLGISQVRALRRRSAAHVGRKSSVLSLGFQLRHQISPMAQQGSPLTQTLRHPISEQWLLILSSTWLPLGNGVKRANANNCGRDQRVDRLLVAAPLQQPWLHTAINMNPSP
jgi:hypothetical protein